MRHSLLVLGLAGVTALPAAAQTDSVPLQAVLANGYRFAYLDRGSGPVLLLVHGALTDYRFWPPELTALSDSFRVITLSRRYHFPNPWRPDDPPSGFATTAADLAAIIRALDLDHPTVVAHSWATLAALELARRYPDVAGGLVLVNPVVDALIADTARRAAVARERVRGFEEALAVFDPRAPEPAVNRLLAAWFGPGTTLAGLPQETRERLLANAHTLPSAAAGQPPLDCAMLGRLPVPTLLVGGGDTPVEDRETLQQLAACLPHARQTLVADAGRALPRSHPAALAAALREFMRQRPR